jgi:hypothetical protein
MLLFLRASIGLISKGTTQNVLIVAATNRLAHFLWVQRSARIAYGKGDGSFASPQVEGTARIGETFSIIAVQDVSGDALPDIVTSNSSWPILRPIDRVCVYVYDPWVEVADK